MDERKVAQVLRGCAGGGGVDGRAWVIEPGVGDAGQAEGQGEGDGG